MPSYDINTYVNYVYNKNDGLSVSASVLILVDSKSNLIPAFTPITINNAQQFSYYFSDLHSDYSKSLRTAFRLLNAGYSLLVLNIRDCESALAARIKGDEITYFSVESEEAALNIKPADTDNLAVKIDINSIKAGSYFLLQQTVKSDGTDYVRTPYTMNTLVYTSENPPIYRTAFSRLIRLDLSSLKTNLEICRYLKEKLQYSNYFYTSYSNDCSEFYIASKYSFDGIGVCKDVSIEYSREYQDEFLSRINKSDRELDIHSTYKSDIEDLEVVISRDSADYKVTVNKLSNNSLHTTEQFAGDFETIITNINSQSLFIRMDAYKDYLPLGKFRLLSSPSGSMTLTDSDFEKAIDVIYSWKDTSASSFFGDLGVNIVYEPDIYSIRSQALINEIFDSKNVPIIKLLNYLGIGNEQSNPMTSYFDCTEATRSDGSVLSSKELYLISLMDFSLGSIHEDITSLNIIRKQKTPGFVNQIRRAPTGYTVDPFICLYNSVALNILDLLPISLINKVVRMGDYMTETDMYDAKNVVNEYMSSVLGYNCNMSLLYHTRYQDTIVAGFDYEVSDKSDIDVVELVLDASVS